MTAGLATLRYLRDENPYPRLQQLGSRWVEGMRGAAADTGISVTVDHCGSMVGMFFRASPVRNYAEVQESSVERFQQYFAGMLEAGIYLAPSAFEVGFISEAHTEELIDDTIAAAAAIMARI